MKRVVLTGGPGAGKTTICTQLAAEFPMEIVTVPEAATEVYRRLGTRWDLLDVAGRRDVQRRIYQLQLELEAHALRQHSGKSLLLLDRGTVDGAAYWPDGPEAYWEDLHTTLEQELERYNAVIWMETAAALGVYEGSQSNPCRFEDSAAAVESGRQVGAMWARHPKLVRVAAYATIREKIHAVRGVLQI